MKKFIPLHPRHGHLLLGATAAILLGACGPGQETSAPPAVIATAATQFTVEVPVIPAAVGALVAQPMFHAAPALLDAPDGRDSANSSGSAHWRPHMQRVPGAMANISTRRLTAQKIAAAEQTAQDIAPLQAGGAADTAAPMAGSSAVATYSPAQIRAAYDLPALPAAGTALTPSQAAQLGAGQTIYIVDAMHNPNAAAELAIFNQKFGLPGCTTKAIATNATLPLPPAPASGCEFSVVYNTPSSTMTATAPAYNSGWAMEIALDVQWAHATAPLARIVLIEAPDASINSLLGAVRLANLMGPGVVSMSFGAAEGSWTASVDSAFTGKNMSYLAATGDSGSGVSWPSVSPNVLAVGGTTLSYSGSGVRSEAAWSGTGGGISAYTALPTYQTPARTRPDQSAAAQRGRRGLQCRPRHWPVHGRDGAGQQHRQLAQHRRHQPVHPTVGRPGRHRQRQPRAAGQDGARLAAQHAVRPDRHRARHLCQQLCRHHAGQQRQLQRLHGQDRL